MPTCDPIGTIHTPFETAEEAPRQGVSSEAEGRLSLDPGYAAGLRGVEVGGDLVVVWFADRADRDVLTLDGDGRGVFATRSPARPNPVCITTCEVISVDGHVVGLRGVDMLDGTPVLDLKRPLTPAE